MTADVLSIVLPAVIGGIAAIIYVQRNLQRTDDGMLDFPIPSFWQILIYGLSTFIISIGLYMLITFVLTELN